MSIFFSTISRLKFFYNATIFNYLIIEVSEKVVMCHFTFSLLAIKIN